MMREKILLSLIPVVDHLLSLLITPHQLPLFLYTINALAIG
jgi:hypothetical protein